ncbi:hypothetical protein niasHT_008960 [Heterodera trifolii]|uniref:Ubiquitin-like domain-containing protein n=1 Tax=Heterodera trifolii TaxID=157864 RepID=A0ABD2LYJ3_9BILA
MEQQQKKDVLVGHTQKLADEQKKCFDKYNELEKDTTIWEIKAKIKDIDFDRHRLTFDGYTLKDNNRTLADYNIGNGAKIHIVEYIDWWH